MREKKYIELGDMYRSEGKYEEAYKYYLESAMGERNLQAMLRLADMYMDGLYLRADYKKAFHYFTLAYDLGMEPIEMAMVLFMQSFKIKEDEVGSEEFRKFLLHIYDEETGYINVWMAQEYVDGVFGTDIEKYIEYCEKAGKAGASVGYDMLGELYFEGKHVKRDYEKAFKYFTMDEEDTSDTRLFYLGEMYRRGLYVKKDKEKAGEYNKRLFEIIMKAGDYEKTDMMFYEKARVQLKKLEEGYEEVV